MQALTARLRRWRADPRVWYRPHARQRDFHAAGAGCRERLFLAGNRVGKTLAGAAEVAFHLTGLYPDWWNGARYDRPVVAWAASVTREATRDILQPVYLGDGGCAGVIPTHLVLERVVLVPQDGDPVVLRLDDVIDDLQRMLEQRAVEQP